jgi:hypothetical protein
MKRILAELLCGLCGLLLLTGPAHAVAVPCSGGGLTYEEIGDDTDSFALCGTWGRCEKPVGVVLGYSFTTPGCDPNSTTCGMTAMVSAEFPGNHQNNPSASGNLYSFGQVDLFGPAAVTESTFAQPKARSLQGDRCALGRLTRISRSGPLLRLLLRQLPSPPLEAHAGIELELPQEGRHLQHHLHRAKPLLEGVAQQDHRLQGIALDAVQNERLRRFHDRLQGGRCLALLDERGREIEVGDAGQYHQAEI